VLASRAGGLPEVLGDAGVLVPIADPAALAGALALLLDDAPRRAAFGQAGRVRAAQFSLPVIAERLINIYRRLVPSQDLVKKTS
jgi:glycosyltransferase involved in cell wall biosynthesis